MWLDTSKYDKLVRPAMATHAQSSALVQGDAKLSEGAQSVPLDRIHVIFQINTLVDVNSKAQTAELEVWLRAIWWDPRLAYETDCLGYVGYRDDLPWSPQYELEFDGSLISEIWARKHHEANPFDGHYGSSDKQSGPVQPDSTGSER